MVFSKAQITFLLAKQVLIKVVHLGLLDRVEALWKTCLLIPTLLLQLQ